MELVVIFECRHRCNVPGPQPDESRRAPLPLERRTAVDRLLITFREASLWRFPHLFNPEHIAASFSVDQRKARRLADLRCSSRLSGIKGEIHTIADERASVTAAMLAQMGVP